MPALINTVVKAADRISAALGYRNAGRNLVSYPETPGT
jgi:hypothetical protein